MNIAVKAPVVACNDSKLVKELNDDNWDEVFDDFIDKIFDVDTILPRTNFEKRVRNIYPAIFNPAELRKIVNVT